MTTARLSRLAPPACIPSHDCHLAAGRRPVVHSETTVIYGHRMTIRHIKISGPGGRLWRGVGLGLLMIRIEKGKVSPRRVQEK